MSPFALIELARAAIGNSVETLNRKHGLWKILQQPLVAIQLHLDGLQHLLGMGFAGSNQCDELTVSKQDRPKAGTLSDGRLARTTRHGKCKQPALENRLFDLGDHAAMIVRPRQVKRQWKIGLAKELKTVGSPAATFWILDRRQFSDFSSGFCDRSVTSAGTFLQRGICVCVGLRPGPMSGLHYTDCVYLRADA